MNMNMNMIDIGYPSLNTDKDTENINLLNKMIDDGKNVFLFIFWDKCGPCHETIPKWKAIKKYNKDDIIALVNKDYFNELKNVGVEPMGFPTLRYINNTPTGLTIEEYNDSSFKGDKDRSVESFTNWIHHHHGNKKSVKGGDANPERRTLLPNLPDRPINRPRARDRIIRNINRPSTPEMIARMQANRRSNSQNGGKRKTKKNKTSRKSKKKSRRKTRKYHRKKK